MAWARVDDQWFAHRKVVGLTLAARGLWTTVLSWSCAQKSADVPAHMVRFLAGGEDIDGLAEELVAAGLWIPNGDGWEIHDWSEYQGKSLSEKRAEAGRAGGKASGEARREATAKQTKQADEANGEAGTRPGPSRPDPAQPKSESRATRLPDDWHPEPEPDLIRAIGGQKAADAQLDRFIDHWRAQPGAKGRKVDWQATWRNWLRRAPEFTAGPQRASPADTTRRQPEIGSDDWRRREAEQRALEDAVLGGAA